jgi:hypothetical protein
LHSLSKGGILAIGSNTFQFLNHFKVIQMGSKRITLIALAVAQFMVILDVHDRERRPSPHPSESRLLG